jgi:hypothetical protein
VRAGGGVRGPVTAALNGDQDSGHQCASADRDKHRTRRESRSRVSRCATRRQAAVGRGGTGALWCGAARDTRTPDVVAPVAPAPPETEPVGAAPVPSSAANPWDMLSKMKVAAKPAITNSFMICPSLTILSRWPRSYTIASIGQSSSMLDYEWVVHPGRGISLAKEAGRRRLMIGCQEINARFRPEAWGETCCQSG